MSRRWPTESERFVAAAKAPPAAPGETPCLYCKRRAQSGELFCEFHMMTRSPFAMRAVQQENQEREARDRATGCARYYAGPPCTGTRIPGGIYCKPCSEGAAEEAAFEPTAYERGIGRTKGMAAQLAAEAGRYRYRAAAEFRRELRRALSTFVNEGGPARGSE